MSQTRTVNNKRIKTHEMGAIITQATGPSTDQVSDSYVFQDDVRLIGFEVGTEAEINDAASNADGEIIALTEISRSGTRGQDGMIGRIMIHTTWNGVVAIGGELRRQKTVFFPEGHGFDFDEGETVNLLSLTSYIGGVASIPMYAEAILYWVER